MKKKLHFLFLIVQTFLLFMLKYLGNIQIFMARLFLSHIPWRMGDAAYLGGKILLCACAEYYIQRITRLLSITAPLIKLNIIFFLLPEL